MTFVERVSKMFVNVLSSVHFFTVTINRIGTDVLFEKIFVQ